MASIDDIIVNDSDVFEIFCQFTGIPMPTVLWLLNGVQFSNVTDMIIITNSFQTLALQLVEVTSVVSIQASKSYEGNYTCIGDNIAVNIIGANNIHTSSVFVQGIYSHLIHAHYTYQPVQWNPL